MNCCSTIDLVKLIKYCLKRIWVPVILAIIGFALMYYNTAYRQTDMYSASGTMYIYNGNPNLINYQYTSTSDLNSAVKLLDTYKVVVKSNKVLNAVAERLGSSYSSLTNSFLKNSLSLSSVSKTGVMKVTSTTQNAQLSADICNAVLDVAPSELINVVGAGSIQIIDFASAPVSPVSRNPMKSGIMGGFAGFAGALGILFVMFILNTKVNSPSELESTYSIPILAQVLREKGDNSHPEFFRLKQDSRIEKYDYYAKLRMNLRYALAGKESHIVEITSAVAGEGKSTIAANLAISCARNEKHVLLVDADLRRGSQQQIFGFAGTRFGLSDVLLGSTSVEDAVISTEYPNLDILLAGQLPPCPAELLSTNVMKNLLDNLNEKYDLVLVDVPPINAVSDSLVIASKSAGSLFIVRQNYSDIKAISHAFASADNIGMKMLGFVFYGEKLDDRTRYYKKYYKRYYRIYTSDNSASAKSV